MATKKTPVIPEAPRRYAPPLGVDTEFDSQVEKVVEALDAAKNPEGITPEQAREMLARRYTEYGGKTWEAADYVDSTEEDESEEFQAAGPSELTIPAVPDAPYWYDDPAQARYIEHYILTKRELGNRLEGNLVITGPAGAGKTKGVSMAVERINRHHGLGLRLLTMNCAVITDAQKWFGRREIDKNGTRYEKSDFIKAIEEGWVILIDEITRLHPTLQNPVFSFLDGQAQVHLTDLNVTIKRHPETVILATANVGAQYTGTHRLDWAMRERFAYTIEREFPPEDEEIKVVTSHTGCDPDAARVLVDIATKTRQMYGTGDLRAPISTRMLVAAGWLVASGMTEREALDLTAVPLYDGNADGTVGEKSERAQVKAAIDGRVGRRR